MDVADVLEQAADALFIYGRAKQTGEDETGAMCALGAISYAKGNSPQDWTVEIGKPESQALRAYLLAHGLRAKPAPSGADVAYWNDGTDDDALVIDTFKRCAKELREVAS